MVRSSATTVDAYVRALPEEQAAVVRPVLAALRAAMPEGFEESMTWGMPTWEVPLSRHPDTYNGKPLMYVALAAQKRHYAVYLTGPYQDPALMRRLEDGFAARGARLDMGKSCVRFRSLESLPLDVIQDVVGALTVDAFIAGSEAARRGETGGGRRSR